MSETNKMTCTDEIGTADYKKIISPKRRSVPTPKNMVEDGKCVFGTFDKEFETMKLLEIQNPTAVPDVMKKLKLTMWEALEVNFDEGILLAACCDMALFGKVLHLFYDKNTHELFAWEAQQRSKNTFIAENLLRGAKTYANGNDYSIEFINDFQDGRAAVSGFHSGAAGKISYNISLDRISKPSVVSIPFDDPAVRHRPLYSQKDFFKASGTITINGKTYISAPTSTAIIDDHRGYYPRKAHYDWITTMGVNSCVDAKKDENKFFAFNITLNQSINQNDYNENLLWFKDETSLLTPVRFERDIETLHFKDHALWKVRDEHDMVNIEYHVHNVFKMVIQGRPIVNVDYFVTFGDLYGYVRDEEGKKYILDGMVSIGEDKTLLL